MRWEIAGWVVLRRWAAPRKLPSLTTQRNVSIDLKSSMRRPAFPSINNDYRSRSENTIRHYTVLGIEFVCRDYEQVTPMTVFAAEQQNQNSLLPSHRARLDCRSGMAVTTSGIANGYVQGNLAILPEKQAADFHRFCQLNPKPCPIIGMSEVGNPKIPALGIDLDIRTDLPRYRVWKNGEVADEPTDITAYWRDDLVAFVLGCSFSFEEALLEEGLPIRHIERKV